MPPTRRALLIGSPYGGLQGPENDVDAMAKVLQKRGFHERHMTRCCGQQATQEGIRQAWKQLISVTEANDVALIYYSGHGAFASPPEGRTAIPGEGKEDDELRDREISPFAKGSSGRRSIHEPWRYQFIVPMDYTDEEGESEKFLGISELELSQLLLDTTKKTDNVTVILDCCHSGRMVRDPYHGRKATRKNIAAPRHLDIKRHIEELEEVGRIGKELFVEGNPHAVRIAAAAPWESAYEYLNDDGMIVGAMTEALVQVLEGLDDYGDGQDETVTWKSTMLRVQELVNVRFAQQHPRIEGPDNRFLFSVGCRTSEGILVRQEYDDDDDATLHAGRIGGVREGSIYAVMPPGSEQFHEKRQLATLTVTQVGGFTATGKLHFEDGAAPQLPREGAVAFLIRDSLYKWPALVPDNLPALQERIQRCRFIRCSNEHDELPLVRFQQQAGILTVVNKGGIKIFRRRYVGAMPPNNVYEDAILAAEKVAHAQYFLTSICDNSDELLDHELDIQLGVLEDSNPRGRIIEADGQSAIKENSKIFISLRNNSDSTAGSGIYVSVFEVAVDGQINQISKAAEGIDLPPGKSYTLGEYGGYLKGLPATWIRGVPRSLPLIETLVFVISDRPARVEFPASPISATRGTSSPSASSHPLSGRIFSLSHGTGRYIGAEREVDSTSYDVVQLSFLLEPA
jgi:hypothetical protein